MADLSSLLSVLLPKSLEKYIESKKTKDILESGLDRHIYQLEEINRLQRKGVNRFRPEPQKRDLRNFFPLSISGLDQSINSGYMMTLSEKERRDLYQHFDSIKKLNQDFEASLKRGFGEFFGDEEIEKVDRILSHAKKVRKSVHNSKIKWF